MIGLLLLIGAIVVSIPFIEIKTEKK